MPTVTMLLTSKLALATIRVVGIGLLAGYLILTGDWHVSILWALAYVGISALTGLLFAGLHLHERFPQLDRYLLSRHAHDPGDGEPTGDQSALAFANYWDAALRSRDSLFTPAEDGLICVPVLLVGIGPVSAVVGGAVFGLLHLGRFTVLDCLGKALFYGLVCYFVLPHGLLTVVIGHASMNAIAFAGLQVARRKLTDKLRSNTSVETDARESGARGSP